MSLTYIAAQAGPELPPSIMPDELLEALAELLGVEDVVEDEHGVEDEGTPEGPIVKVVQRDDLGGGFSCRLRRRSCLEEFEHDVLSLVLVLYSVDCFAFACRIGK